MSDIIEVILGLTLETLYDGRIEIWTATNSSKEVTEKWYANSREVLESWTDLNRPYLALLDMSRVVLTPFGRAKASDLAEVRPEIKGRVAIVVSASTMGHMTRLFVDRSLDKTRERRVFFSRDDALRWLEEVL